MNLIANDMTDRQWAAAFVIDNSPIAFDPLAEIERIRFTALDLDAAPALIEAFDGLIRDLDELPTIREQRALLTAITRGEA